MKNTSQQITPQQTTWQHPWQSLGSGAPIIPYAHVYQNAIRELANEANEPSLRVVEIGTFDGCSARILHEELTALNHPFSLTLIDIEIREAAKELITTPNVAFLEGKAEDVAHFFLDASLDFLHVDMSPHSFEQHIAVHTLYWQKLRPGHSMIIHDYHPMYGTYRFVNEVIRPDDRWTVIEVDTHPDSPTTRPVIVKRNY